jgi:hypothetical protein
VLTPPWFPSCNICPWSLAPKEFKSLLACEIGQELDGVDVMGVEHGEGEKERTWMVCLLILGENNGIGRGMVVVRDYMWCVSTL